MMPTPPSVRRRPPTVGSPSGRPKTKAELEKELSDENKQQHSRRDAIKDAISLAVMPLATLATVEQIKLPPGEIGSYTLDVLTIEQHTDAIADAVVDLANQHPVVGVMLDRLANLTPFSALFGVAISLGVQIAENHRALPPQFRTLSPNLIDRNEFARNVQKQAIERTRAEQDIDEMMDSTLTGPNNGDR